MIPIMDKLIVTLFIVFMLINHPGFTLPEDKTKMLQLRANTADINQETHSGIYTENVELDQGSTHLRAAKAITKVDQNNKLIKAIAEGNKAAQAHFWTLTHQQKPPLHAYANTIRYFPNKHLIQLIGNARVEQGKDFFSAPEINYDTLNQHITSQSNSREQTLIIIHPEDHHE